MEWLGSLVSAVASSAIIFGGVVPYIPQYNAIVKSRSTEGFSTLVCFILLVASVLRILFWWVTRPRARCHAHTRTIACALESNGVGVKVFLFYPRCSGTGVFLRPPPPRSAPALTQIGIRNCSRARIFADLSICNHAFAASPPAPVTKFAAR